MEWKTARHYDKIEDVGILALPHIIENVKQGQTHLIRLFSRLVDGELPKDATPQQVLSWWDKNKDRWTIPYEKLTPTADPNEPPPPDPNQ
jgi:hypothetical protein